MNKNYEQTLSLLRAANSATIDGKRIYEVFLWRNVSLWNFWQYSLWFQLFPHVGPNGELITNIAATEARKSRLKTWILQAFMIIVSGFSLALCAIRKPHSVIFTSDIVAGPYRNDPRISLVYETLISNRLTYVEFIHTRLNRAMIKNFFYRGRPVIYLESLKTLLKLMYVFGLVPHYDWPDVRRAEIYGLEEKFVPIVRKVICDIARNATGAVFNTKSLQRILFIIKPKNIILIDDSRNWNELLLAARLSNIQSIAVQHARLNRYTVGYNNFEIEPKYCVIPDLRLVWNKYWRDRLLALSSANAIHPERVIIGGKPFSSVIKSDIVHCSDNMLTIFFPFEPRAIPTEAREYLGRFLQEPDIRIIYKLRRDNPRQRQIDLLPESMRNTDRITLAEDITPEQLSKIDVATGTYSSSLYEMAEAGIPVGVLCATTTQAFDLIDDGYAEYLDLKDGQMITTLRRLAAVPDSERQRRAKSLVVDVKFKDIFAELVK